eukprot:10468459-Alexandrium_andersonii.AAC.1
MSASLVGSEMCIRDSANEARGRPRTSQNAASLAAVAEAARNHVQDSSVAVSYTHLTLPTICSV